MNLVYSLTKKYFVVIMYCVTLLKGE